MVFVREWKLVKARVERPCWSWGTDAKECKRTITVGETFYQCTTRCGLAVPEICMDCADKSQIVIVKRERRRAQGSSNPHNSAI